MPDTANRPFSDEASPPARSWVPTQDFAAGLALLALAAFGLFQSANLPVGTLSAFGPGLLPKALSVGILLLGALILVLDYIEPGERISAFNLRAPIFIAAALMAFAVMIKPLGLLGAVPVTIAIAGLASPETRWREIVILAVIMTVGSIVVFGILLTLSIPIGPAGWSASAFTAPWK